MFSKLAKYNKLWLALLGAVVTVIVQFFGQSDWVQIVVALLTALGVYQVPNREVEE